MATISTAIVTQDKFQPIVDLVLDSLNSPHSKRAYGRVISAFLGWWRDGGKPAMVKATVQKYKVHLQEMGLFPSTINLHMSAIRKLAAEAADNGLIPQDTANAIGKVKGVRFAGVRVGNWLTKDQAQILINTPDTTKIKGLRDRAILAVLVGSGLRRSEVANLEIRHIRQREGRWVIVDLVGKGNRVRTVPIPSWVKVAIDEWAKEADIRTGRVFRCVYHYGNKLLPESKGITPQAIYYAVQDEIPICSATAALV